MEEVTASRSSGLRAVSFLTIVTLICGGGVLWLLFNPAAQQRRMLAADLAELGEEVELLRRQNEALRLRRDALESDPQALEKETRRQLGLVAPGERHLPIPPARPDFPRRREFQPPEPYPWTRPAIIAALALQMLTIPVLFGAYLIKRH